MTSQTKNIDSKTWNYSKSLTFHSTQIKIKNFVNSRLMPMWSHSKVLVPNNSRFQALSTNTLYFISACLAVTEVSLWRWWFKGINCFIFSKNAFQDYLERDSFGANMQTKLHSPSVWHSNSYNLNFTTTKFLSRWGLCPARWIHKCYPERGGRNGRKKDWYFQHLLSFNLACGLHGFYHLKILV